MSQVNQVSQGACENIIIVDFDDSFTYNIACELSEMGLSSRVISASELAAWGRRWGREWERERGQQEKSQEKSQQKRVVIYGPGPGHPDQHRELFPTIKTLMEAENIFHLGICLGHQLLWGVQGVGTRRSRRPLHGQAQSLHIPSWEIFDSGGTPPPSPPSPASMSPRSPRSPMKVQCYHSLVVDMTKEDFGQLNRRPWESAEEGACRWRWRGHFKEGELLMSWGLRGGRQILTYQFHPESVGTSFPSFFFRPLVKFLYNGECE